MDSYVVFDPTPDSRHIYVTVITPDSGETLLCLFQVPLLAGSASGIANSNTPEPSQPLDVRLVEMELKYCVDTPTGLGTTLPKSANAVLFGKKSAPRFYRFGDLALPAKNRHHLRVLLPAERLGEHVEPFVHCRGLWLGKTFLVLSCNAGRLHCQVSTIIESDDAATATAPLRLIGFVPSDVRIFHVTRNPWQGELLVCAPSGAWGEVHVYQYTSD
ncbi:hypothetical protein DL93DRAFT_1947958 [Clavulina sp. PMI_390]|nr:hypothetical protein DL93DRAFT_1947958 [Clavulina sp. PMI_390]